MILDISIDNIVSVHVDFIRGLEGLHCKLVPHLFYQSRLLRSVLETP